MKQSFCYIIYSKELGKFYTGVTQDTVEKRIDKHNQKMYGNHFTSLASDWELYILMIAEDFAHAIRMERKIKAMKSSKYIRNLKKYTELRLLLFQTTKST
jgi:putative endonuclease